MLQALTPLHLASASPRRKDFFLSLGPPVTVLLPPPEAEPRPLPGEHPAEYALRGARAKAKSVLPLIAPSLSGAHEPSVILAADTVVFHAGRILGKPQDASDAFDMLCFLRGETHSVITGCVLLQTSARRARDDAPPDACEAAAFAVTSKVTMWPAPDALLRAYAHGGEPLDKAGAYGVQGAGASLVQSIDGSWSNVVGLPLAELTQELLRLKAVRPAPVQGIAAKTPA